MYTLERFGYDVLFRFFLFFFCSAQVFCCVAASRNWSCRTNHVFALLIKWLATGKAKPKQGTAMFQQNSVQGLLLLFFFKCILGSGCFYLLPKSSQFGVSVLPGLVVAIVFPLLISSSCCLTCVIHLTVTCICTNGGKNSTVPLSMCWAIWNT